MEMGTTVIVKLLSNGAAAKLKKVVLKFRAYRIESLL
jgi:hypothetical protein